MKKGIFAAVIIVLLIGGGVFALTNNNKTKNPAANTASPNSSATPSTTPQATTPTDNTTNAASTITYTNSGFSPSPITVKAGTEVTVKNNSSFDLQFSSDDHPTHLKDPELNQSIIGPGQNQTFTVTVKGTWGYHNHQNPSDTGTIIVQ